MGNRKILAPFDRANPNKKINGFLYPNFRMDENAFFLEVKGGKEWEAGIVVFVGREISKDDVFAKIVDSGTAIRSVAELLQVIDKYLHQVAKFRIGDVVGVVGSADRFELIKLGHSQQVKRKLPE